MEKVVLSLFDGMSCAQLALNRAGIHYDKYYASEIDQHAIKVTQHNFPNTIQLGSVVDVKGSDLPPIWGLFGGSPCQGFSFAGKGKGMSTKCETEILTLDHYLQLKNDGFEFEGQSYLFWEYMRILHEVKPKYFLLENVEMGEKWEKVLSKAIGVNGIHINSALVSAQNRRRIYWTNIGIEPSGLFGDLASIIPQPKDRGILLKDILETEVDEKYYLSDSAVKRMVKTKYSKPQINPTKTGTLNTKNNSGQLSYDSGTTLVTAHEIFDGGKTIGKEVTKSHALLMRDYKGFNNFGMTGVVTHNNQDTYIKIGKKGNIKNNQDKASYFTAGGNSGGNHSDMDLIVHNTMPRSSKSGKGGTGPLSRNDGKTYCLDTGQKNAVEIVGCDIRTDEGLRVNKNNKSFALRSEAGGVLKGIVLMEIREVKQINNSKESGGKQPYQQNRVYDENGISPSLDTRSDQKSVYTNSRIRRLTPLECERLQTVPDFYTNVVSDTQRYRMFGNGWTVDVIAHIFSYIK